MQLNSNMHIVYASDDNFAEVLGVSIVSLFQNNKDAESITIYILDSGISNENKRRLEEICCSYNRRLPVWIKAINIEDRLNMKVKMDRGSLSQYARLFIAGLLPDGLDRVLYLDCDIIVNKSLNELWNLNIKGNTIATLMDAFSKYYRVNIGLKPDDIMFNSGVMLIDLNKWKENCIEEKLMEFITRHNGEIQQGDQGALNAILSYETFCFEPRFNSVTIFYDFTYQDMMIYRKPPKFYSEIEIKEAVDNPVIIHFTTSFLSRRPWIVGCEHKYLGTWLHYKKLSPWREFSLRKYKVTKLKKYFLKIYKILPHCLSIRIAEFFQVYGRPLTRYFFNI